MTKKVLLIIILFISIICIITTSSYAEKFDANAYKPSSTNSVENADKLGEIGNRIIGIVRVIGTGVSVIALMVIGIKYTTASVEEKAEYKKTMVPYIIGAVMLFAITNLLAIIESIVGGF